MANEFHPSRRSTGCQTMTKDTAEKKDKRGDHTPDIKINKEFESLIPPLTDDEFAQLERSILEEGVRDPLIVWSGHGVLLDGHNRLKICKKHDKKYKTIEMEFPDPEAARAFIIRNQLSRRNLSPEAVSYLRGKRYAELKRQGKKIKVASGQNDQKVTTAAVLAAEYKVGEKTIRRDAKFAAAVDSIADNCGNEAKQGLLSRDTGLTRGQIVRLSRMKPGEQKKYIEELIRTGRRPRKKHTRRTRTTLMLPTEPKALVEKLLEQLDQKQAAAVSRLLHDALEKRSAEKESVQAP